MSRVDLHMGNSFIDGTLYSIRKPNNSPLAVGMKKKEKNMAIEILF